MTTPTLRPTEGIDDYSVVADGVEIGRIFLSRLKPDRPWFWCILSFGGAYAPEDMGFATDLDGAETALRARWVECVEAGREASPEKRDLDSR